MVRHIAIPARLQEAIAGSIVHTAQIEKECAARGGDVREGELYLFRTESTEITLWCTALRHPDEPCLMYAVPADNCPLIGVPDVAIPDDAPCGPLSIRCGFGLWLNDESFWSARRIGILDEPSLKLIQDQLAGLASGQIEGTELQFEDELDPEYEEQLARIAAELDWLAEHFAG